MKALVTIQGFVVLPLPMVLAVPTITMDVIRTPVWSPLPARSPIDVRGPSGCVSSLTLPALGSSSPNPVVVIREAIH